MRTPIIDGGPAFPSDYIPDTATTPGMSLRDWFAGQALCGLQANSAISEIAKKVSEKTAMNDSRWRAVVCYELADAMLAARSKTP